MTPEQARTAVATALNDIAPEIEFATIRGDSPMREQAEIDSFDFLNFLLRLKETSGVEVPEADYKNIETLNQLVGYLCQKAGAQ